jgi:DNA mismatch repair ATPase MutS
VKKFDRLTHPALQKAVEELADLEDQLSVRRVVYLSELQSKIAEITSEIGEFAHCIAELDCLVGLSHFVALHPTDLCRPTVLPRAGLDYLFCSFSSLFFFLIRLGSQSYLQARGLKHPLCLTGYSYVPNDVSLGGVNQPSFLVKKK